MTTVETGYLDLPYLTTPYLTGNIEESFGAQLRFITQEEKDLGIQMNLNVVDTGAIGVELGFSLVESSGVGVQFKADTLRHALCPVYLEGGYLEDPYLTECMGAFLGMQLNFSVNAEQATGVQFQGTIDTAQELGAQLLWVINTEQGIGVQFEQLAVAVLGMQTTFVIYNVTQLRLMTVFPSRGTAALGGDNWIASNTASGDYFAKNLNTDIIEQVYRSVTTNTVLTCDTGLPQGVPVDTIAILGHNLTTSATVQVQGSQDNFASAPAIVFNMKVERDNMFYIAPTFPTSAGQNRYWRFTISDPTNPSGFIEIGTIIFGVASIFSVDASFVQPLVKGYRHFKDSIQSEGFTVKSNDRALKKYLKLRYESLDYTKSNFKTLDNAITFARTSLKMLVIPTPEYSSRFAVFGKLAAMPEQTFIDNGVDASYVTLDMEWDESL